MILMIHQQKYVEQQSKKSFTFCLGQIANFAPVVSRNTIIRNSTSVTSVWHALYQHYGFQEPRRNCLNPNEESRQLDEERTDDDISLRQHIQLHSEDNCNEEECKVTVKQLYGVCDKTTDCSLDRHLLPTIMDRCYSLCLETCQRHPTLPSADVHFPQAAIPTATKEFCLQYQEQTEDMTGNDMSPGNEKDMRNNMQQQSENDTMTNNMLQQGEDDIMRNNMRQQREDGVMRTHMLQQREDDVMGNNTLKHSEYNRMDSNREHNEDMMSSNTLEQSEDNVIGSHVFQPSGEDSDIIDSNVQGLSINVILCSKDYLTDSNTLIAFDEDLDKCSEPDQANVLKPSDEFVSVDSCFMGNSEPEPMQVDSNLIIGDKQKFAGGDETKSDYLEPINNDLNASQDDVLSNDEAEPCKADSMHSELELSGDTAYSTVGQQQQDTNEDQKRSAPQLETGYLSYMLTGVLAREKYISSQQAVFHIDNITRHEVPRPITSTGKVSQARKDHRQQLLHPYQYPQEHQCRVVEFRSLCTFSGMHIMDNDVFCGHVTSEIAFQPTVGEHLTPVSSTMYLYPVKSKLTLVLASVNLYQDDLDFWNDSADTLIISAIHATHKSKEMLAHGCLSATMCGESSLQSTSLKNSLHQPQCHRGLLLEDTLGCQWSGGEVFMFLKRIFHGLPIALHGGVLSCSMSVAIRGE